MNTNSPGQTLILYPHSLSLSAVKWLSMAVHYLISGCALFGAVNIL